MGLLNKVFGKLLGKGKGGGGSDDEAAKAAGPTDKDKLTGKRTPGPPGPPGAPGAKTGAGAKVGAGAGAGAGAGSSHVEPTRPICPECGRQLLPGTSSCPFCKPQVYTDNLESTIVARFTPQQGVVAMGGVLAAARLAEENEARGFLHVYQGKNKGMSILLGGGTVSIGRGAGNVLALNDGGVSTKHAEVWPDEASGGFIIVDAESKNGTFVNEQRIKEKKLANGDLISFGDTRIYVGIL